MSKHWSSYCMVSIVHFMAFPETSGGQGPIVETVRRIAEDNFFDAIELAWAKDPTTRKAVREVLRSSRLQAVFCAHPAILSQKLDLNSPDEAQRVKALQHMKELMAQASELDASRFVFLSGPDPGPARREAALALFLDSVRQMCIWGREKGIALALETFDRRVDKKALIGPVEDAARVAKAIRTDFPDFGLLYDLSHMPLLDETPEDMVLIRDSLVHVHVGNCVKVEGRPLYGDLHPCFGFPGGVNGVKELTDFIRGLFEIGYLAENKDPLPWIGFEVKPQGTRQTSESIIANAKRTWRQAWAQM